MANPNIKPLSDRVLVKPLEAEEKSKGGIIIPDSAKEKPQEAQVVALGTGKRDENGKLIEFSVKAGDKVLISKYGGTEVKLDGEEVLIINVGARSTTLSFVGPSGVNIQSATNIGGNLLTQGVSDNTGQPFAVSEAIKVGYFSGIVQLTESDPQVAILQANSQTFIRRLAQDINRRLINLKRGTAGRQPTRILLTGRGALVPGLSEQLSETLRLPPELFDPSAFLRLGKNVSAEYVQHHRHQISEVIGEAARLVLPQTAGVNLIPRNIASQVAFDARKPWLIVAAALAAPVGLVLVVDQVVGVHVPK